MSVSTVAPVEARLDQRLGDYWLERVRQHTIDSYVGVELLKFPEDLRAYDHVLWDTGANVVVEIGTKSGGSALWFRDRLTALARYRPNLPAPLVVSLDLDNGSARDNIARVDPAYEATIRLLDGDVRDDAAIAVVEREIPRGSRCLVVEDSAHVYDTTLAALRNFSHLVASDCCFVVEDGCVDIEEMRLDENWPRGVIQAIDDWLATEMGSRFARRRDLERYLLTCHPRGFLQATS